MQKRIRSLIPALILAASFGAHAEDMKGMPMKDMPMKDMPMKEMPMKDMPMGSSAQGQTHHATGTVKNVDAAAGTVTFAHGPVKSLNWPAMVMAFKVKDKALLDKLTVGKEVEFDFVKEGPSYIVTTVQ